MATSEGDVSAALVDAFLAIDIEIKQRHAREELLSYSRVYSKDRDEISCSASNIRPVGLSEGDDGEDSDDASGTDLLRDASMPIEVRLPVSIHD